MPSNKKPLFQLVVERLAVTDERQARALVMAGRIYADGQKVTTPGTLLKESVLLVQKPVARYVSRGGEKLAYALKAFDVELTDKVVADIGASTGGFVDCCLQNGARMVYAIDVGTNQLHYSLRSDSRVTVMENTNLKVLKKDMFAPLPELVVCDVSFISLRHVFKVIKDICPLLMALVKPQFEATRQQMSGTEGLCPLELHPSLLKRVEGYGNACGYVLERIVPSPVKGKQGKNVEYVSLWRKEPW